MGDLPDCFLKNVFWCNMVAVGQTWHRLVIKYMVYPWRLATVVDGETSSDVDRRLAASDFLELSDCCLCEGFGRPLRIFLGQNCTPADLLPGGQWFLLLKSTFQFLPFNVAVENAFARMKNMQRTCRGRNDITHSLSAKHVLAEVKAAHVVGLSAAPTDDVSSAATLEQPVCTPQPVEGTCET